MSAPKHVSWLLLIVAALAVRLAVVGAALREPSSAMFADDYMQMAKDWDREGYFTAPMYGPAYPYLCRVALKLLGDAKAIHGVLLLQACLGALSCLLLYGIALAAGSSERAALISAALLALEPMSIVTTGLVATETIYMAIPLLGLWVILRSQTVRASLISGLLLGAASLVRGVGMFAALGLAVHWLVSRTSPRRPALAGFAFGLSAPLLLWSVHTARHYGTFSPGCSLPFNLAVSWAGIAKQRAEGLVPEATMDIWDDELGEWAHEANPFKKSAKAAAVAARWMITHPWPMAKELCRSTFTFWLGPFRGAWEQILGPLPAYCVAVLVVARAAYALLAIVGLFTLLRSRVNLGLGSLSTAMIVFHEIPVGCAGYGRYAVPVMPFVSLLAAIPLSGAARGRGEGESSLADANSASS